jgi:tetratricopeptide (TPR) repeat protein
MRNILILGYFALGLAGCSNSARPQAVDNSNANSPQRTEKVQTVAGHTTENENPPMDKSVPPANTGAKTKWSQSGNPIDTKEFDARIAKAEKDLKAKPKEASAKTNLSQAYYERGMALTDARQYASALGDFRRAVKLDPANEDAKGWIDQIISIYNSINKEFPKEGEEPPPLPFKEGK